MDRISRYIIAGTLAITQLALANADNTFYKPKFWATAGFEEHHMHALVDIPLNYITDCNTLCDASQNIPLPLEHNISSPYLGLNIEIAAHENLTFGVHGQLAPSNVNLFIEELYLTQSTSPTIGLYGYYTVQDTSFGFGVDLNHIKSTANVIEHGYNLELNYQSLNPKIVLSYILHFNGYSRLNLSGFASLPQAIKNNEVTSPQNLEFSSDDSGVTKIETGFKISYSQEVSSVTSLI